MAQKPPKREDLDALIQSRVTSAEKQLMEQAAKSTDRTLSSFIRWAVKKVAREVLGRED